jgi:ATP-dependent Clp protease ATP-binding subunit ClpA
MFEHFTEAARGVVVSAGDQARTLGHTEVLAEHVLLGVMADTEGIGARALRDLGVERDALVSEVAALADAETEALRSIGVDLKAVRGQAEAVFGPGALDGPRRRRIGLFRKQVVLVGGQLPFADTAKRALKQARWQAQALDHDDIGSEHILLCLLSHEQDPAALVLARLGLDAAVVRGRILDELQRPA